MSKQELHNGLHHLFKGEIQTFPATVLEVDEEKQTCVVQKQKGKLHRVRLKSVIDSAEEGLIIIPVVDSSILVSIIGNDPQTAFVSRFSKVQKVIVVNEAGYRIEMNDELVQVQVGESIFKMEEDKITLNDGSLNGLIKHDELKKELDKNSKAIQAILDLFKNWTPVPQDGGAALKTASASLATQQVGKWDDIENDKIVHG